MATPATEPAQPAPAVATPADEKVDEHAAFDGEKAGSEDLVEDAERGYGTTAPDAEVHLGFATGVILASISFLALAISFSIGAPTAVLTYLVRDIGTPSSIVNASWIVNSSSVVQAVIGPPISFLTDLYGRRTMLIVLSLLGIAGSAVSATANDIYTVIGGQIMTGFTLALKPVVYAIASEVVPRRQRALVQYLINILASIAAFLYSIVGPAFIQRDNPSGWRNIFYLQLAFLASGAVGILLFYRPPPRPTKERRLPFSQRVKSFDLIGTLLFGAGLTLFLVGLTFGGVKFPWKSAQTLAPLLIGAATLVAFGLYEWKGTSTGMCHHALFRDVNFPLALIAIFVEGCVLFAILGQYTAETAKLFDPAPIAQGLRLIPFWLACLVANFGYALYSHYTKDVRWTLVFGYGLFMVAAIIFATADYTNSAAFLAGDVVGGLGFASPLTGTFIVAQLATPPLLIGTASALMSTSRAVGASVSTAIYTAIITPKITANVPPRIAAVYAGAGVSQADVVSGVTATMSAIAAGFVPAVALKAPGLNAALVNEAFQAARDGYAHAYRYVWYTVIAFCGAAIISVAVLRSQKAQMTQQVDAPAERVTREGGKGEIALENA